MTTVWDEEIASMWLALDSVMVSHVLVVSDSQAAIALMQNSAACGSARMADLRAIVDMVEEWDSAGVLIHFACVKAHVGVAGNKLADEMAKVGCERNDDHVVTESGVQTL